MWHGCIITVCQNNECDTPHYVALSRWEFMHRRGWGLTSTILLRPSTEPHRHSIGVRNHFKYTDVNWIYFGHYNYCPGQLPSQNWLPFSKPSEPNDTRLLCRFMKIPCTPTNRTVRTRCIEKHCTTLPDSVTLKFNHPSPYQFHGSATAAGLTIIPYQDIYIYEHIHVYISVYTYIYII